MSTELVVYDKITDPMQFVREMGTAIAKSGMFGCSNEQQGQVLAMACLSERKNPVEIARTYHIIQGRLAMRADAMLANFRARGGKHRVIARDPDRAEVELSIDGDTQRFSFTFNEAQQEPFVWSRQKNGERVLKDNWATPRGRMQMLWARVVSDGVRTMAPEVVAGYYVPEEIDHDAVDGQVVQDSNAGKPQDIEAIMAAAAKRGQQAVADRPEGPTGSAENAPTAAATEEAPLEVEAEATESQLAEIRRLLSEVYDSQADAKKAVLGAGVSKLSELTAEQANVFIELLQEQAKAKAKPATKPAANTTTIEVPQPDLHSGPSNGPCSQVQIEQIKSLVTDLQKTNDQTQASVKAWVQARGKNLVRELTSNEADELIRKLFIAAQEGFFEESLQKDKKGATAEPKN